jgi:hypothetical protein
VLDADAIGRSLRIGIVRGGRLLEVSVVPAEAR